VYGAVGVGETGGGGSSLNALPSTTSATINTTRTSKKTRLAAARSVIVSPSNTKDYSRIPRQTGSSVSMPGYRRDVSHLSGIPIAPNALRFYNKIETDQ
jgi:hypothetical protein